MKKTLLLMVMALMCAFSVAADDEATELLCDVEVNSDKITNGSKEVFNELKQAVTDYMNTTKDKYKSVRTLINRRNAIKRAVTKSNAETFVRVGEKEYTVAEAIDMKNFGMNYQRGILAKLESQWRSAQAMAERENGEKLDRRADEYIKSLYENADMKNMSEEVKKVRDAFIESQSMDILDPIDAQKVIKELNDEIDSFMSDVDSALSVSNALTTVEVEYDTL